jgi:two-component system, OmpR family, phosphate regulon sensor histidine kinase PhoR
LAWVDERAIEIAVINLIDNALKYAGGTPSVRIWVLEEASRFVVSVVDEGPGIAESERRRIFERFVRGSTRNSGEAVRGSGIGLSLVLQIAEAHGGTAWVEPGMGSKERPGSAFRFSIRKRQGVKQSAASKASPLLGPEE